MDRPELHQQGHKPATNRHRIHTAAQRHRTRYGPPAAVRGAVANPADKHKPGSQPGGQTQTGQPTRRKNTNRAANNTSLNTLDWSGQREPAAAQQSTAMDVPKNNSKGLATRSNRQNGLASRAQNNNGLVTQVEKHDNQPGGRSGQRGPSSTTSHDNVQTESNHRVNVCKTARRGQQPTSTAKRRQKTAAIQDAQRHA